MNKINKHIVMYRDVLLRMHRVTRDDAYLCAIASLEHLCESCEGLNPACEHMIELTGGLTQRERKGIVRYFELIDTTRID